MIAEFLKIVGAVAFLVFFFGFCIFIHELGHFVAAKVRGLHIIAFSLGFRKFWWRKINGVEYRLGYLPFGGYVELPQIDTSGTPKDENGNELPEASPVDRIVTAAAGPLFNIMFGLVLGCLIWIFGVPQDTPKMRAITVAEISETGPEYQAGLRSGDKIIKLNGRAFYGTWSDFAKDLMLSVGKVTLEVEAPEKKVISYTPEAGSPFATSELKREKIAYPHFMPSIPFALFPEKGSVAERAGIEKGDILLAVNDRKIASFWDFQDQLDAAEGQMVELKLQRGDQIIDIRLTPEPIREPGAPLYLVGFQWETENEEGVIKIENLIPGYPAEAAGLKRGDVIRKVNGVPLATRDELSGITQHGKPMTLEVERSGETFELQITPKKRLYYTIGIKMAVNNYPNPFRQLYDTIELTYKSLRSISYGVGQKMGLTESGSTIGLRNMSGPVGIARVLFISVYNVSFMYGIYFVVIISFALAIFNLLPLPVLDGGHCLIAILELIFKRKMPETLIRYISMVFIVLLVGLMVYVTLMDIYRIVPGKYLDRFTNTETKDKNNVPATPDQATESK